MAGTLDYRQVEKKDAPEGAFPAKIETEYRVCFSPDAYSRMKAHAATTDEVEIMGVLVGDVKRDTQGPFLYVTAVIEGEDTKNYGAQVTLTHQAWQHIYGIFDKQYSDRKIVGWYHTHPGFGVFLSKMDMFIQENYFNAPFHVAVVIETKRKEEGCFAWVRGSCLPLARYWVGNDEVHLVTGAAEPFSMHEASGAQAVEERRSSEAATSRPAEESRAPMGLSNLFFLVVFFLCGFLLGQNLMMHSLRATALEGLESEIYSVLEFAGMNAMASKDFAALGEKLETVEQALAKQDPAAAEQGIKDLSTQLATLKLAYDKPRKTFRKDMSEAMSMKQTLSGRVRENADRQDRLETYVGMLFVMRLSEVLRVGGRPIDIESLSPAELGQLKTLVETAVRLYPECKETLARMHPGLIQALFPERKESVDEKAKTEAETKSP